MEHHEYSVAPCLTNHRSEISRSIGIQTELTIEEIDFLYKDLETLKNERQTADNLHRSTIVNRVIKNDASIKEHTGFHTKEIMTGVFSILEHGEGNLRYDQFEDSKESDECDMEMSCSKKRGPQRKLPFFHEFILCMLRLRLGLGYTALALLFGISKTRVGQICNTWIAFMEQVLVPALIIWPSRADITRSTPLVVKNKFPNLTCIIDCFEIFLQKPKAPTAQSQTYSSYKSHNTIKFLVSILPNGCINFVSPAWSGNVSDKFITANCGFLDNIQAGDVVMADRGFTIQDLLLQKSAFLIIPPFTRKCNWGKGKRLNQSEIVKTRAIAHVRIHVERAIGRIKDFQIFSTIIPLSMKNQISGIVSVVSALCNLQPPLVK